MWKLPAIAVTARTMADDSFSVASLLMKAWSILIVPPSVSNPRL
jgi:hypothetical protein